MNLCVDRYLARRFDRERYNCWDLLREAWLELTGQDIGDRTPHPATAAAMRARFESDEALFVRLAAPVSPSIILLRQGRAIPHVGLFWQARVLHMGPGGTRYERLVDASRGFDQVGFYGCKTSS